MLVVGDWLAKLLASLDVLSGLLNAGGGSTKRTARNIESAAVEPLERNLEPLTPLANNVFFGYLYVIKRDNSCRLTVPAHLVLVSTKGESFHPLL